MNLAFLDVGMAGVLEAALIALLAGVILQGLVHVLLTRRLGWSDAHEIGWAYLATLLASCSVDIWKLFYMDIVPLQSPVTIRRVLAGIHDPDHLGTRVVFEIVAAGLGVMLGWFLFNGRWRRRHGRDKRRKRRGRS